MAQGIVHVLEFIEVEHRDSYFIFIPLGLGQGNTQAIGEELPVGKTRQGIMVGHLLDLFRADLQVDIGLLQLFIRVLLNLEQMLCFEMN